MNQLQIFSNPEFGQVRTVEENGKVLFCGSDVAKALGYARPSDAISQHCKKDGAVFRRIIDSLGREQQAKFIPEGDLYRLITHSKLESAERFERWVFEEVLPSIRKHGMYAVDSLLENPDLLMAKALQIANIRLEQAKTQTLMLEQKVAEYEPKAQYVDYILKSPGALAITQIAADYGLSARKLNKILHEERVQHNVGGQWILYAEHMSLGYTKSETIHFVHSDGTPDTKLNTKWTQKGRLFIHGILERRGIVANVDRKGMAG